MIYLIGTGPMAQEYAKILIAENQEFIVIGRGQESSKLFESNFQVKPFVGGLDIFLDENQVAENSKFIIASGTENLMYLLKKALLAGADKILIEKPAAISIEELLENEDFLRNHEEKIFIAYNRRFYASVIETKRLIEEDGGLQSMNFEFTEWSHKIEPLIKAEGVKENWFFANSTHVVDLAFYLAGKPFNWETYSQKGSINWHDKTNFSGAGITDKNVLFSYLSNWESAGRWGVELLTKNRRIYLKPLEEVHIQNKGSILVEKHIFNLEYDEQFKPGLYKQIKAFLEGEGNTLCGINEHIFNTKNIYKKMIK